jgi:phage tail-like protein
MLRNRNLRNHCGNVMKKPRIIGEDPFLSFRFKIVIDGLNVAGFDQMTGIGFNEVTGLTFETEVETFREGGLNTHEHQLFGPSKCPEKLVLKRGLAGDELWQWYKQVMSGKLVRKNHVAITLRDYSGAEVPKWTWMFKNVCPVKWTGPQFRAGTAEVAFDTIELIHRGLRIM